MHICICIYIYICVCMYVYMCIDTYIIMCEGMRKKGQETTKICDIM